MPGRVPPRTALQVSGVRGRDRSRDRARPSGLLPGDAGLAARALPGAGARRTAPALQDAEVPTSTRPTPAGPAGCGRPRPGPASGLPRPSGPSGAKPQHLGADLVTAGADSRPDGRAVSSTASTPALDDPGRQAAPAAVQHRHPPGPARATGRQSATKTSGASPGSPSPARRSRPAAPPAPQSRSARRLRPGAGARPRAPDARREPLRAGASARATRLRSRPRPRASRRSADPG